jgi:hypothetical protein
MANRGNSADAPTITFTTLKVGTSWEHLGLSVTLANDTSADQLNTDVRAWKSQGNDSATEVVSSTEFDDKVWTDSSTGYSAVIGALVDGANESPFDVTSAVDTLQGFMF